MHQEQVKEVIKDKISPETEEKPISGEILLDSGKSGLLCPAIAGIKRLSPTETSGNNEPESKRHVRETNERKSSGRKRNIIECSHGKP